MPGKARSKPSAVPPDALMRALREGPASFEAALAALADRPMDVLAGLTELYLQRESSLDVIERAFAAVSRQHASRSGQMKQELEVLEEAILSFAQHITYDTRTRSVELPGLGTVRLRKVPASVSTEDEEAVLAYLEEHPDERERYTEVVRRLLKTPFRDYVKQTGEAVPGMKLTPERDSVSVQRWEA